MEEWEKSKEDEMKIEIFTSTDRNNQGREEVKALVVGVSGEA